MNCDTRIKIANGHPFAMMCVTSKDPLIDKERCCDNDLADKKELRRWSGQNDCSYFVLILFDPFSTQAINLITLTQRSRLGIEAQAYVSDHTDLASSMCRSGRNVQQRVAAHLRHDVQHRVVMDRVILQSSDTRT